MSMYTSIKNAGLALMRSRYLTTLLIAFSCFIVSSQSFGQTGAGNIDQIRNGPANDPSKNFWDNFDNPMHVNGNAGSSNAHYVEGHSISYRSLLTLLTSGNQYEYVIEYDTKHSDKMALDYLTHFQRLLPHNQFNHAAEIIYPRILETGSKEYLFTGDSSTFAIPAPAQPNPGTPSSPPGNAGTPVPNMPQNSFNALSASPERLMTIYRGTITNISYDFQQTLTSTATSSTTRVRIRFTANSDSVLLAWGGHIASRLDWGFIGTVPRSAGGISGSPYHMRQISMNTYPGLVNIPIGNQDRSLSAAAVIPPPSCPTVNSQTICSGGTFGTFSINSPDANTVYTWSIPAASNTAGAAISGSATGTSVTIVKSGGGNFTSGSFTLNISAVKNGITVSCPSVATGTVEVTAVNATANPTLIDITSAAHNTTLTANIDASSTDNNNANYDYVWSILTGAGALTNENTRIATYTADAADAGSKVIFKVIATQKDDGNANTPECVAEDTVQVDVSAFGICDVSPSDAVCEGTDVTHNATPSTIPANATYTWSLTAYQSDQGTTGSQFTTANGLASITVDATESYRITLSQTYQNTALNTSCSEDVSVVPTPSVSTKYNPPSCSEKTFSVEVTNPVADFKYSIDQPGNNKTFTDITPTAGNLDVKFTGLDAGDGYTVTVTTTGPGCTATSECEGNDDVPPPASSSAVVDPTSATKVDQKKNTNDLNKVSDNVTDTYTITLPSGTKVKPLPNPYTDKVRFNLISGISGQATLEIHNVLGQKIAVVYQGYIQAGKELTKEYYVPSRDRGTLIYTFRVGDQKISGKLVPVR